MIDFELPKIDFKFIKEPPIEKKDVIKIYNLPKEVKFCKKCVVSNQRPRITFDAEGVCSACRFSERKNKIIDWEKRDNELRELCDEHRSKDGSWDAVVPCSGGKDSVRVAHMLKHRYGMHPLTVTWAPHKYTEIGWGNLQRFIHGGFDNILFTPNGQIHRRLTRLAFEFMGDPFQPFIFGQYSIPFKVALFYNISLVFYGEDGEVEYGGSMDHADRSSLSWDTFVKNRFSAVFPETFKQFGITQDELNRYSLTEDEMNLIKSRGVEQHFFSYYHKWVPQENYYYAAENTGFQANPDGRSEGTYSKYASLDDQLDGFHYYMSFIKFGIGRATSDAAHEIRDGHITREEGVRLVRKFDGEFPKKHFKTFLAYTGLTKERFWKIVDSFRSPHLWEKTTKGEWKLKHQVE
jgi:N-acetyl sugar amidotransferase